MPFERRGREDCDRRLRAGSDDVRERRTRCLGENRRGDQAGRVGGGQTSVLESKGSFTRQQFCCEQRLTQCNAVKLEKFPINRNALHLSLVAVESL